MNSNWSLRLCCKSDKKDLSAEPLWLTMIFRKFRTGSSTFAQNAFCTLLYLCGTSLKMYRHCGNSGSAALQASFASWVLSYAAFTSEFPPSVAMDRTLRLYVSYNTSGLEPNAVHRNPEDTETYPIYFLRTFDSSLWSLCTHHLIVTIVTHRPLISFFGGPSVIINHKPQTTNHEPQTSNHQPQTTNHKPQRSKWRSQQLNALLNRIPWACKPILCQFTNYCARAQELSHRQECVHTFCCLDCNNCDGLV